MPTKMNCNFDQETIDVQCGQKKKIYFGNKNRETENIHTYARQEKFIHILMFSRTNVVKKHTQHLYIAWN